jgi:hypothetical protein
VGDSAKSGTTLSSGYGDDSTDSSRIQLAWSTWTLSRHNISSLMESLDDITDCLSTHTKGPSYLSRGAFSPMHVNNLDLESGREGHREGKKLIVRAGSGEWVAKKEKNDLLITWYLAIDMVCFLPSVTNHIFTPKKQKANSFLQRRCVHKSDIHLFSLV